MDPRVIRLMRIWPGKPRALSVRVTLWEAACDALTFFNGSAPKIESFPLAVHLLARKGQPGECRVLYIAEREEDSIEINQFVRAIGRDGVAARWMLCELGGLTDPFDQADIQKHKTNLFDIAGMIELHHREGVSWDEIFQSGIVKITATAPTTKTG